MRREQKETEYDRERPRPRPHTGQILCSCGGKCKGECRAANLYRPRKDLGKCPAAYN